MPNKPKPKPKPKRERGRPRIDPAAVQERYVEGMGLGMPIKLACEYAGFSEDTYFGWQRKIDAGEGTAAMVQFFQAAKNAESRGVAVLLARIRKAAEDPARWQAAAWLLERRYPEQFARSARQELAVTGAVEVGLTSEQHAKRAVEKLNKMLGLPKG